MQELNTNSENNYIRFFGLLFLVSLIIAFIISCKKKEFPVKNEIPDDSEILYFKGEINGNHTEILMNNSEIMNEVSCNRDSMNVFVYESGLLKINCNTCNEFKIQFRDNQLSTSMTNGNFSNWMFQNTELSFWNQDEILKNDTNYIVEFKGWGNKQMLTYTYVFDDGAISYAANPIHEYDEKKIYNVRFYVFDPASQQQSMAENKINIHLMKKNFYYYIKLDTIYMTNFYAVFSAKNLFNTVNPLVQYWWKVGNGSSYVQGGQTKGVAFNANTFTNISLKVVNGPDTVESHYQLAVNTNSFTNFILTSNFHVNYFYEKIKQSIDLFLKKSNIIMKYDGGKIYESKLAGNSNYLYKVTVTNIKDIQSPVEGYLAKRIKFNFNANLVNKSDNSDTLKVRNAEAKLIFIYKNSRP
jgi:hypothetical protein